MPHLFLAAPPPVETALTSRIGGRPLAPRGSSWPTCATCKGAMQFLGQFRIKDFAPDLPDRLLSVFMCQNDPGMCDDYSPISGGNIARVHAVQGLEPMTPPRGETMLSAIDGLRLQPYEAREEDENAATDAYESARQAAGDDVLGRTGRAPVWVQSDETPTCRCGQAMRFVLQLEDTGGGGINFGDLGCGYVFLCMGCGDQAQFLWQCT